MVEVVDLLRRCRFVLILVTLGVVSLSRQADAVYRKAYMLMGMMRFEFFQHSFFFNFNNLNIFDCIRVSAFLFALI